MARKRLHARSLVAALVVAGAFAGPLPAGAADIVLGAAFSLTTDYALSGAQQKNGVDLAVEEANAKGGVNGSKLRVEYADNAASTTVGVNALNKVLSAEPVAVFLTVRGALFLQAVPLRV